MKHKLIIFIPIYNEAENVAELFRQTEKLGCSGFLVAARGTGQIRQEAEFTAVKEDARPIVGETAEAPGV